MTNHIRLYCDYHKTTYMTDFDMTETQVIRAKEYTTEPRKFKIYKLCTDEDNSITLGTTKSVSYFMMHSIPNSFMIPDRVPLPKKDSGIFTATVYLGKDIIDIEYIDEVSDDNIFVTHLPKLLKGNYIYEIRYDGVDLAYAKTFPLIVTN